MTKHELTAKQIEEKCLEDTLYRRKIFEGLCSHISRGRSLDSFVELSKNSIVAYLKAYPNEFCQVELDAAVRKGKVFWESIGEKQADGRCMGNSRTWYYNMANRYGWRDKTEIEATHSGNVAVNVVSYGSRHIEKAELS